MDWKWFIVDFLPGLRGGLMVGGTYGLMCVGLGIIFGVMRVVNFAQGDFMMLGMYVAYYLVTGFGVLAFLGPYAAPIVGAVLAGPVVFVVGWLVHRYLLAHVTGARVVSAEAEGHYAQIILTLGVALVLANGGLILFGSQPISVQTPLSRESWEIGLVFLNKGRTVSFVIAVTFAVALYLFLTPIEPGQGAARRRGQSDRRGLRRHRCRPLARDRLRARGRDHGRGRRADRQLAVIPALHRLRLRHRHVRRRRARRHG